MAGQQMTTPGCRTAPLKQLLDATAPASGAVVMGSGIVSIDLYSAFTVSLLALGGLFRHGWSLHDASASEPHGTGG
jgi:hypothetical protein